MAIPKTNESRSILARVNSYISEGISHCDPKHVRMEQNNVYATVEQWSKGDILKQALKDRPAVPWNSVFKVVQAIANREIVERFVPKVLGRSDTDAGIAEVLDEACRWQRQQAMSEHLESSTVRSTVTGGYGWIHKYWDQSKNYGEGMIVDEDVPIWEMLWPARARMMNLADRRWHVRGKWVTIDEARARWGDLSPKVNKLFKKFDKEIATADVHSSTFPDTSSQMNTAPVSSAFGWGSIQNGSWINTAEREIFVVEAEWIEPKVSYRAAIPTRFNEWETFIIQQGELPLDEENTLKYSDYINLPMDQQEDIMTSILMESTIVNVDSMEEIDEFSDRFEYVTRKEFEDYDRVISDTVKYAIIINDTVLDYGDRPWGFSYYCITGFPAETRNGMDFIGVVDIIKGPQDYKNALLSNMLAMYMSSPKAPFIVEKDAIPDMDEFVNRMASPGAVVPVPAGFLASNKFMWGPSPSFPPMAHELLQIASTGVEEAFGLSSIDLGTQQDLRRVSGNVVQAARAANNVIVALIFDGIRMFRKQYGLCNMKFITHLYSPQEIIRIVGPEKIEDIQSVDFSQGWGEIFKYDIIVDESPSSPSELMDLVDFLTRTGTLDNWRARGDVSFEDMLRLMPQIPESDKRAMIKGKTDREQYESQISQLQSQLTLLQEIAQAASSVPEMQPIIQESVTKHQLAQAQQQGGPQQPQQ